MNRQELRQFVADACEKIKSKFDEKNQSYGCNYDAFHNFRSTAVRVFGSDSLSDMLMVAEILKDKHSVAIAGSMDKTPELAERLLDRAIYNLIELGMVLDAKSEECSLIDLTVLTGVKTPKPERGENAG